MPLDTLEAHQVERVRQAIEARRTNLWFLSTYSPDVTPIEEAFAKPRALLCRAAAITPQDARGWCAHCGYPVPNQDL